MISISPFKGRSFRNAELSALWACYHTASLSFSRLLPESCAPLPGPTARCCFAQLPSNKIQQPLLALFVLLFDTLALSDRFNGYLR